MTNQRSEWDVFPSQSYPGAWRTKRLPAPPVTSYGAIEIHASPAGSDLYSGLSALAPLRTVQAALDLAAAYAAAKAPFDVVVRLAVGSYPEDVVWNPPCQPQRRVILKADKNQMTVLAQGVLTAATPVLFTDAGAAFGVLQQLAGKLVRISTPAGVEVGNLQIRSHTNTAIKPVQSMTAVPGATWRYQVLEPSTTVRSLHVSLPWVSARGFNSLKGSLSPALILQWLRIGPRGFALRILGGEVTLTGCEVVGDGTGNTVACEGTVLDCGQLFGDVPDPATDNPVANDFDVTYPASVGVLGSHITAIRADGPNLVSGAPVAKGPGAFMFSVGPASWSLFGGAIHGSGAFEADDGGWAELDGGFDPSLAFLVQGNAPVSYGIRAKNARVGTNRFGTGGVELRALGVNAFLADQQSKMTVKAVQAGAGDVPGVGVSANTDSQVRVDAAVTFPTGGSNLQADDGTSTFAGLAPATPVVGAAVLTGSRIWEG